MTSCLSPYSALSLVRQRTHALRQSTVAGFASDFHLAQCSLPRGQAHEAWHHGRYAQKDSYELGSGMSRLVLLVAIHLALCSLR